MDGWMDGKVYNFFWAVRPSMNEWGIEFCDHQHQQHQQQQAGRQALLLCLVFTDHDLDLTRAQDLESRVVVVCPDYPRSCCS